MKNTGEEKTRRKMTQDSIDMATECKEEKDNVKFLSSFSLFDFYGVVIHSFFLTFRFRG